jgi:hypothetical protein
MLEIINIVYKFIIISIAFILVIVELNILKYINLLLFLSHTF